ncbi:MAG: lytic transglycosylase domain-containing protein [Pseudomonadota bacterium]
MARRTTSLRAAGGAAALALLTVAGAASAQVLSIGDDGAVTTFAGPTVHTSAGFTAIEPPAPAPVFRATPAEVAQLIQESSARHALPPSLVEAVAWQESRFNHAAVSPKGARGVMQLLPKTASELGVDPSDLRGNIEGGAIYLARQMQRFGDVRLALAAYNAGPEAVARYGGVPPYAETQNYVRAILARLSAAGAVGAPR